MKGFRLQKVKFGVIAIFCLLALKTQAQQEVMYSQYMFNTLAINPAYAGSRDVLSITALGRQQWSNNIPGAPVNYSFTIDSPVKNEKMGLGLVAYHDEIGVSKTNGINLVYSYKLRLTERTTLSLGIQPTVSMIKNDIGSLVNIPDQTDPNYVTFSKTAFNAGAGIFISNDKSYLGFSVPQIIETKVNSTAVGLNQKRHNYLMAGLVFGSGNVKIKPSTMVRYTKGVGVGFDVNTNFWFRDKLALGVSARKSQMNSYGGTPLDAIVGMFELQMTPQIKIGYAYDYTTTKLKDAIKGGLPTHELMLRYEFGFNKEKILTPRYF